MSCIKPGHIYVIWLREFLQKNEPVFKVGRTGNLSQRLSQYPKGSHLLFTAWTADSCKCEGKVCSKLSLHFVNRTDIGREYYEGNLGRLLNVIWGTLQAEQEENGNHELPTPCVENPPPKASSLDPMESLSQFVSSRRDNLSGTVQKSLELYQAYTTWPQSLDISHKRFVSGLRELYGATVSPHRFDDGMHQGIIFPDLVSGPKKPIHTLGSHKNALVQFIDSHIVPDHNGLTARIDLWKLWKEFDVNKTISKRNFNVTLHDIMAEKGFHWYNDTHEWGKRLKCCWRGCRINND